MIETGRGESGTFALRLVDERAKSQALVGANGGALAPNGDLGGLSSPLEQPRTRRVVPPFEEDGLPSSGAIKRGDNQPAWTQL